MPSDYIPFNYIFYITYKHYYSSTKFIINSLKALYKTYKSYKINSFFYSLIYYFFNSIYIREKKRIVLIILSRPSIVYKPNYNRYYSYYYFRHCFSLYFPPYTAYINLAAIITTYINLAATTYINLALAYYSLPYYRAARL